MCHAYFTAFDIEPALYFPPSALTLLHDQVSFSTSILMYLMLHADFTSFSFNPGQALILFPSLDFHNVPAQFDILESDFHALYTACRLHFIISWTGLCFAALSWPSHCARSIRRSRILFIRASCCMQTLIHLTLD